MGERGKNFKDLADHSDSSEGRIEQLITDQRWLGEFIGIRVTSHGEGVKLACSTNPEDVYVAVRFDRRINPTSMYYFYKPAAEGQNREGLLMGGSEQ